MMNSITKNKILRKLFIIGFWLLIWELLYIIIDNDILFVSPLGVLKGLIIEINKPNFLKSVLMTFLRVVIGYSLALILGTLLSIITHYRPIIYELIYPFISLIKSTPVVSFILLALVWLKSWEVPSFIAFLMVFPVVWTNVSEGIRQTDKGLLEVGYIYKVKPLRIVRDIYIPSVLPYFKTASITGLSLAWKSEVAAEVIAVPVLSVGKEIYNSKIYLETQALFAWTGIIVVLSVVLERVFVVIINKLTDRLIKIKR